MYKWKLYSMLVKWKHVAQSSENSASHTFVPVNIICKNLSETAALVVHTGDRAHNTHLLVNVPKY